MSSVLQAGLIDGTERRESPIKSMCTVVVDGIDEPVLTRIRSDGGDGDQI